MWRKTLSLKILYPKPYNNWYHNLDLPINLDPTIRMTNELPHGSVPKHDAWEKNCCVRQRLLGLSHIKLRRIDTKSPYNNANKLNALIQTQEKIK
jgi:hypothetical protein